MKTSCAGAIRGLWDELNQGLFPWIDDNIGELDARHRLFIAVCEAVIRPSEFDYAKWKGNGRPPASRLKIFKAFLLKAVLNVKDTKELVRMLRAEPLSRRLCGWDSPGLVPSETRFCRVFGEFAERGFTDEWFAEMIVKHHDDIPAETVSYDSAEANMAELPVECEWGCVPARLAGHDPARPAGVRACAPPLRPRRRGLRRDCLGPPRQRRMIALPAGWGVPVPVRVRFCRYKHI